MFKLFRKNKTYTPTVTPEDKDWIEKNLIWLMEAFGADQLLKEPFVVPTPENFPYDDFNKPAQFEKFFCQMCSYWNLNPEEITVKFFDDIYSKQWSKWQPMGELREAIGLYYQTYTIDSNRFTVELATSLLNKPQLLISVLSHELSHVKLLGGRYIDSNSPDMEPFTDLATIYCGFGLAMANSGETRDDYWIRRTGYLPFPMISYTNALLCYISGKSAKDYLPYINTLTKSLFIQDFEFLTHTNHTLLTKQQVQQSQKLHTCYTQIDEGFAHKEFDRVIERTTELLNINPKNKSAYNNLGYALLQQKKYQEAIEVFTKAITIDPYWDYPYNNRGYCKLQLRDFDNAFADLHSSYEMNPDNSFSWRNMGVYYLMTNDLPQALEYLEEAYKIDPNTELIYFYLAKTYQALGESEKASQYWVQSQERDEHNDSLLEYQP